MRIRRSLAKRSERRRRSTSVAATLAILLAGTVSWALVGGSVSAPRFEPEPATQRHAIAPRPPPAARPAAAPQPAPSAQPAFPKPIARARVAPVAMQAPVALAAEPIAEPEPSPGDVLYAKAHELHFHGTDRAAALSAWDAYLAAEPAGRFAVEARYNRALCLLRLGRVAEARAALVPFARGEVEPAGYRQTEAAALVDRIAE
jgi:hypothetical protein